MFANFLKANWDIVLLLLTTIAGAVLTFLGNKKNGWFTKYVKIIFLIVKYIQDAEALDADGKIKKEIVLSKVRTECLELDIDYNTVAAESILETLIAFSKVVNARSKDKGGDDQTPHIL